MMQLQVLKHGNREGCGWNGIWRKNILGCMAGLTLTFICVAAGPAGGHTVRGVSERGPAINQGPLTLTCVAAVTERCE